jgi:hypothetical protein
LQRFFRPILEHLKIGMAVSVNKAGRHGQAGAINGYISLSRDSANRGDAAIFNP